jgi:hypothetical protein
MAQDGRCVNLIQLFQRVFPNSQQELVAIEQRPKKRETGDLQNKLVSKRGQRHGFVGLLTIRCRPSKNEIILKSELLPIKHWFAKLNKETPSFRVEVLIAEDPR